MNLCTKDNIRTEDVVFGLETNADGVRSLHIYGYGYDTDEESEKKYRFVEFTFFYAPLEEALKEGMTSIYAKLADGIKQYITDCTFEEMMDIYHHYDDGECPTQVTALTADMPDGIYVLVSEED